MLILPTLFVMSQVLRIRLHREYAMAAIIDAQLPRVYHSLVLGTYGSVSDLRTTYLYTTEVRQTSAFNFWAHIHFGGNNTT